MPTRPPADDSEPWPFAADVLRRLDDVERRIIRVPEGEDTILQVYEDGEPLGDVRHLDFGPGVLAEKLNADWARVTGPSAGGGGSWATVTVAAYDSHDKAKEEADFVCTGVNDEVTLNLAMAECVLRCTLPSLSVTMGKIGLYQGTYLLKAPWTNVVSATARDVWFQGLGTGVEIRADTGWSGAALVDMQTSFSSAGRTIVSDMQINADGLVARGLRCAGPFSPNPTTHRMFGWNLLVQGATTYQVETSAGVAPATFFDNVETVGGVIGIYADSVNASRITNCRVKSATSYGILSRGRVIDCIAENCDIGIYMNNAGSGSIESNEDPDQVIGCVVLGTSCDIGIQVDSISGVVAGNIVAGVGQYGIVIGGSRNVVSSNRVRDSGLDGTFAGIRVEGDENHLIGNKVRDMTGFGLQFIAGADNNIDAFNDLRNNTGGTYTDAGAGNLHYPTTPGTGMAPSNADYLVGTANADLSAEIVVGPTPGGQLNNTWADPKVDDSHGTTTPSSHTDFIAKALVDAKGDIITATADDTPVRKAVGADGTALVASAAEGDGLVWGTPAVLNFAAATTLGTVVGKVEIFDGAGVSLGFLPVYDAIT